MGKQTGKIPELHRHCYRLPIIYKASEPGDRGDPDSSQDIKLKSERQDEPITASVAVFHSSCVKL
jgi:hypothetical protein